jgi:5,10-methylene-tetrahydrofolate dehydrogenase/methenyl tetrahydrofolate cyclohydrolase
MTSLSFCVIIEKYRSVRAVGAGGVDGVVVVGELEVVGEVVDDLLDEERLGPEVLHVARVEVHVHSRTQDVVVVG